MGINGHLIGLLPPRSIKAERSMLLQQPKISNSNCTGLVALLDKLGSRETGPRDSDSDVSDSIWEEEGQEGTGVSVKQLREQLQVRKYITVRKFHNRQLSGTYIYQNKSHLNSSFLAVYVWMFFL